MAKWRDAGDASPALLVQVPAGQLECMSFVAKRKHIEQLLVVGYSQSLSPKAFGFGKDSGGRHPFQTQ